MNLQILHNQVVNLELQKFNSEKEKKSFSLQYINQYDNNDNTIFNVVFDIEITQPEEFIFKCKYVTWFKTSEPINENFKTSELPNINAPAIAFPFLRSFISTITLNAGYLPVILPSINFTTFPKHKFTFPAVNFTKTQI